MNLQKLTYSGAECNNYLYFSFNAEIFDTKIITETLEIQPTSVMVKNDPVPKSTSWKYRIEAGNEIDLEIYLEKLIALFESKINLINELKDKFKLDTIIYFVVDIDINPDASTPYFGLNRRAIEFLYKTKTTIDFDLYKSDTIGLLE